MGTAAFPGSWRVRAGMGMRIERWKKGQFGVFFYPVTVSDFRNKEAKKEGIFAVGLTVALSKITVISEANNFLSSK